MSGAGVVFVVYHQIRVIDVFQFFEFCLIADARAIANRGYMSVLLDDLLL